jgi:hypothetical protein
MDHVSPDVMMLTETWLTDDTEDKCVAIANYDLVRRDKPKNFPGAQGVVMYIKQGIVFTHRTDLEHKNLMNTAVQINLPHQKPLVLVVVYRRPHSPVSFFDNIEQLLSTLDSNNFRSVVSGDFNLDVLQPSPSSTRLLEIADTCGLKQTIQEPTRVTMTSSTCLDLTFTNLDNQVSGVENICIADHFLNYIVLKRLKTPANHRYITCRNLKRVNEQQWKADMDNIPWSTIEVFDNINDSWHAWKSMFLEVVDAHAPVKKFRGSRKKKKAWRCEEVDRLRELRDYHHHRACLTMNAEDWARYRQTRNQTTQLARQRKTYHFTTQIEDNRGNSKAMWKVLKDLLPTKSASSAAPTLELNNDIVTDLKEVCNVFNNYFIDIGARLSASIPAVYRNSVYYLQHYLDVYLHPPANISFSFTPVSQNHVLKTMNCLSASKATGLDNIQVQILKLSARSIAPSLAYLFNFSLRSGVFPDEWKAAKVCPIHKKGSKLDPGNYRPVSVLPAISKIMERIVHDQLYSYLASNNLLSPQQSGFKKLHSCQTSLHRMTEYLFSEIHKRNVIGLVALDLKKAFDTVNHEIMLSKMELYGVREREKTWFQSYLSLRSQRCCINSCQSDPKTVLCGVPQGSILGPLLFILYVNDLPQCFSQCQVNIYADDTAFYVAKRTVHDINEVLQTEFESVHQWLCANQLSLHVGKTASMLICSRQKRAHLQDQTISLSLNDEAVSQVEGLKYLGVYIDCNLNFDQHIDEVCRKLRRALGILRRAAPYVDQRTRITLYNTLLLPHFDYCSTVWGTGITQGNLSKLQKIQNCAMRIVLNCDSRAHINDMLNELKWLNIEQRLMYNLNCLVWKSCNQRTPNYLQDVFTYQNSIHGYNTRQSSQCAFAVTPSHRQSLLHNGTKSWNLLPPVLKSSTSFISFKNGISSHLAAQ